MYHLAPVRDKVTGKQATQLFLDSTDVQTERVNRVLEDTLCSIYAEAPRSWSDQLPMVEFSLDNEVPLNLRGGTDASIVSGGEAQEAFSFHVSDAKPESSKRQLPSFIDNNLTLISRDRDTMTHAQDKQK
ncbi:Pol protein [Phytophthora palmivora]|uniref:Pol protein n=1 Tax=Phytophthora palmivora TaxID=4796 RepID=A0A2P4XV26_9STRA|nr:Pol protein [Phytophthora palmivora]